MSCQQSVRPISATRNAVVTLKTREDPYTFTETPSTTPPILFNVQVCTTKNKTKVNSDITTKWCNAGKISLVTKSAPQKLPLTQLNGLALKTPFGAANFGLATQNAATTNCRSIAQTQQQNKNPIATNVPSIAARPQQQLKPLSAQQQHQHQQHKCYEKPQLHQTLLPTPSLWQTPLLLDTLESPPRSSASLSSPTPSAAAPSSTSAALPPSKFHHTTFAQHLQKVDGIKKSPATSTSRVRNKNNSVITCSNVITPTIATASNAATPPHSHNDLNEIPVNVIYRKPQKSTESIACTLLATKPPRQRKPSAAPLQINLEASKQATGGQNVCAVHISPSSSIADGTSAETAQPSAQAENNINNNNNNISSKTTLTVTKTEKCSQTDGFPAIPKLTQICAKVSPLHATTSLPAQHCPALPPAKPISANGGCNTSAYDTRDTRNAAFAVVTCFTADSYATTGVDEVSDASGMLSGGYYRQQHWLSVHDLRRAAGCDNSNNGNGSLLLPAVNMSREARIVEHKDALRRQAMQLHAARQLLQQPLKAARRTLVCVDQLLRKHKHQREVDSAAAPCILAGCRSPALPMTSHCYAHIAHNCEQQLFLTCTAKFADNSQCRIPVFDIVHDLPLCTEHARKRDAYNRSWHEQHPVRKLPTAANASSGSASTHEAKHRRQQEQQPTKSPLVRNNKRKTCSSVSNTFKSVGRPQKRSKKTAYSTNNTQSPSPQPPPPLAMLKQRKSSNTSLESLTSNSLSQSPLIQTATSGFALAPPALAPLSAGSAAASAEVRSHYPQQFGVVGSHAIDDASNRTLLSFSNDVDVATNELSQLVAQLATVVSDNNNSNSQTDFSSGLSLPSADELLTQDMLSICENSSAYASSEDTGVGGLSETELMAAAHDGDDIPLGDTRLLEEHDLTNVLNALPVDAFNELFTVVRQDERDEVERALEIADKHLKSLQQTMASDTDFLGDFLNDQLLDANDICGKMEIASSALHSPDTLDIDTATLFGLNGSADGNGAGLSCPTTVPDIRGLLQT